MNTLEQKKAGLRGRIGLRRLELTRAVAEAAEPLRWIDAGLQLWRSVSPTLKGVALAVATGAALRRRIARHEARRWQDWIALVGIGLRAARWAKRALDGWIASTMC